MKHISRLKTTSSYNHLRQNWFLVAFLLLLTALSIDHLVFLPILIGLGLVVWKKNKIVFLASVMCSIIFLLGVVLMQTRIDESSLDQTEILVGVIEVTPKNYHMKFWFVLEGKIF